MAAFHPRLEDLPSEFAVFPLAGALLLPRGKLPLNIFEKRYLAMVLDSLGSRPDVRHDPAGPAGAAAACRRGEDEPGLYRVGCLGRLSSFSETDDGRLLITLTGLIRFTDRRRTATGAMATAACEAIFPRYTGDLTLIRPPAEIERDKLLAALRGYFGRRNVDANWEAIRGLSDDALVITLAMACPFEPVEKQALLEAPTDADRAATLLALLQMGAAGPDLPPGRSVS